MRPSALAAFLIFAATGVPALGQAQAASAYQPSDQSWVPKSNAYTQTLVDIENRYSPESASAEGLVQYDTQIGDPSFTAQLAKRKEIEAAVAQLIKARSTAQNRNVAEDLSILIAQQQLNFRVEDYSLAHGGPYINATAYVFGGLQPLLDDQVPQSRRIAAVERLKRYAGIAPGQTTANVDPANAMTSKLLLRANIQLSKPGLYYPTKDEIETSLNRNAAMVDGLQALFVKYHLTGWEPTFNVLKQQLTAYDSWARTTILPHGRTDFRLAPEDYALSLEQYGVDIPPAQLAAMAHQAFIDYQGQMQVLASQIAHEHNWSSTDYRDVIRELKQQQLVGEAILPFYEKRLHEIEKIIVDDHLVTLPDRPAIIRLGTLAESAQLPAPHMVPPPFLHNTGQRGVFVLPLSMPAGAGQAAAAKVDDYTFDAASWTLIAHEARPGHELQFDSMVEHGVSLARVLYAFNSTNVEGWGLYAEYITLPYMPKEGQLISLQFRLLRAARAFIDPELQAGKLQPADAMRILTQDVVFSVPFANQEVERYTFRSPGQATSYFYGYTRLLELRKETEEALGAKFNGQRFHDFILAQGLLPPGLMKNAVDDHFIPEEKAR